MRKTTKVWLIIAASLVIIGFIIFTGVMTTLKWDFTRLSTVKLETNNYEIGQEFDNIHIKTDTADIIFKSSDDGKCKVECYDEQKAKHSVAAKNGTLFIELKNNKRWYDYIGINFGGSPKITVYLPKTEYASLFISESTGDVRIPKDFTFKDVELSLSTGDVNFCASASEKIKIKTTTGDIGIDSIFAGELDLSVGTGTVTALDVSCAGEVSVNVSTGKAYLTDFKCKSIISDGNTGDIYLDNVIAEEKLSIKRSTGDIRFNGSDAAEILVETDTGNVTGTFLTDKVFIAQTDTGRVDVPKTTSGGRCEIITDTGNIKISVV